MSTTRYKRCSRSFQAYILILSTCSALTCGPAPHKEVRYACPSSSHTAGSLNGPAILLTVIPTTKSDTRTPRTQADRPGHARVWTKHYLRPESGSCVVCCEHVMLPLVCVCRCHRIQGIGYTTSDSTYKPQQDGDVGRLLHYRAQAAGHRQYVCQPHPQKSCIRPSQRGSRRRSSHSEWLF